MNPLNRYGAGRAIGWLIVGLTVLPLLTAAADSNQAPVERIELLLAKHDVRLAIYSDVGREDCASGHDEDVK